MTTTPIASTPPPPTATGTEKQAKRWLLAGTIFVLALLVYLPVRDCGYIWDDDDYVIHNETLRDGEGLRRIWLEKGAVPQYYPLVHTMFWIEFQTWGLNPKGYHIVNVLLHALSGMLLFLLLRGLKMPGAWLAGAIFALHPVHVESVAWITERKNVLSLFFYLLAAMAYLRFDGTIRWPWTDPGKPAAKAPREKERTEDTAAPSESPKDESPEYAPVEDVRTEDARPAAAAPAAPPAVGARAWKLYFLSFFFFVCALLSKTVTCSLPAALLLVGYWKRGRLTRRDILPTLPLFAVGLAFGLLTAGMEKTRVGAVGRFWEQTFIERALIAGRAVWFYAWKLIYPHPLSFTYSRWTISQDIAWLYIFPVTAVAVVAALWFLRHRLGRGPLVAVLFFGGTLFPALGFFNVFPMRYSYVADHFQYHASIGIIALLSAGIVLAGCGLVRAGVLANPQAGRYASAVVGGAFLVAMSFLTQKQIPVYQNYETLFRDALAKAPESSLALTSVAAIEYERNNREAAVALYRRAIAVDELDEVAHFNLGKLLLEDGNLKEAEYHLGRSWQAEPECAHCHYFYALALSVQERVEEALPHYEKALELDPNEPYQHYNYAITLIQLGRFVEGEVAFLEALRLKPDMRTERYHIVDHYMRSGRPDEAERILLEGLRYHPDDPDLNGMLQAVREFRRQRTTE